MREFAARRRTNYNTNQYFVNENQYLTFKVTKMCVILVLNKPHFLLGRSLKQWGPAACRFLGSKRPCAHSRPNSGRFVWRDCFLGI